MDQTSEKKNAKREGRQAASGKDSARLSIKAIVSFPLERNSTDGVETL
jgi:hypothetical protein